MIESKVHTHYASKIPTAANQRADNVGTADDFSKTCPRTIARIPTFK